ncbi:MAG: hypothetical protein GWN84_00315 [Gammaproteobacteria bacterium]|nr:hypothetical protein [Gammaproteobacteria bacterium]NIR81646.1 hypothetical protein [Gammaproteobacteria bacterium]NIR88197.1 hypothetical protein [Gammaproteobacteria bacterium]NIU02758.1 hypothetical protein [Gammaproteobacteria bacterium]NIV73357.1 hypothetical protein [Gammaproteobacteria bacterium]
MAVDLIRVGDEESRYFHCQTWEHLLRLARLNGWRPAGTKEPEGWPNRHPWDRFNYSSSDGQTVTAADARAIADALSRALQFQTALSRQIIADFVAYCRSGWGFWIR